MTHSIGPYEIRGELGRGAMAVVWRAFDTKLQREVAVKEPVIAHGTDAATSAELAERFVREGRAAAQLNHPGIVTIYSADVFDGRPAIVMELIEGETLSNVLSKGPLEPATALAVLDQLLDAVAYAHGKGVVHRDIKPDNVFVTHDGRVKLADFGIAHVGTSQTLTQAGAVMGTPGYMAPEQVTGDRVDARTDLFAIGTMGYEMLAGRNPFGASDGTQPTTIMYRIVHEQAEPLPDVAFSGLPFDVRPAIQVAMAKDPAARFPDAASFRGALRGGPLPYTAAASAPYPGIAGQPQPTVVAAPSSGGTRATWLPWAAAAAVGLIAVAAIAVWASSGVKADAGTTGTASAAASATAPAAGASAMPANATLSVEIAMPTEVVTGEAVKVTATPSEQAYVSAVRFYDGATLLYTDDQAPYEYEFTAKQDGQYSVQAKAVDVNGKVWGSKTVAVVAGAAAPTPAPAPSPAVSSGSAQADIMELLYTWCRTVEREDEYGHMACYASVVSPFMGKSSATNAEIQDIKSAFFGKSHSSVSISTSDEDISMDGPDNATVTLRKTWNFGNGTKSVRQRLWVENQGGQWYIVGEKDL